MTVERPAITEFFAELDGLKLVNRRSYIAGGVRLENSAEHSWHVAMAAWALARQLDWEVSIGKLLKLALVHDLGELDAGDTFLYAAERQDVIARERDGVTRLAKKYQEFIPELEELWEEQELGKTNEARVLKIADRILPLFHNISSNGKTWIEHGIKRDQVLAAHGFIATEAPELFKWIERELDAAVAKGWLKAS